MKRKIFSYCTLADFRFYQIRFLLSSPCFSRIINTTSSSYVERRVFIHESTVGSRQTPVLQSVEPFLEPLELAESDRLDLNYVVHSKSTHLSYHSCRTKANDPEVTPPQFNRHPTHESVAKRLRPAQAENLCHFCDQERQTDDVPRPSAFWPALANLQTIA